MRGGRLCKVMLMAKRKRRKQPISIACTNCDVSSDRGVSLDDAVKLGWKMIFSVEKAFNDPSRLWPYTMYLGTCKDCEAEESEAWREPLKTFRDEEPDGQLFA